MAQQTILVAEDSPTTRRKIAGILEDQGYRVLTAEDGQQAIELTHEHHPELVLLDIVLPKKNGYQVCRSIKSCLLYTSPSPRDATLSRMPSSA